MKKFVGAIKNFYCSYCKKPLHEQCCCPQYHTKKFISCDDHSELSEAEIKQQISELTPRKCKGFCVIYDM
jgi:hypothetical protein